MPQTGQKYQVVRVIDDEGLQIGGDSNPMVVGIDSDTSSDEAFRVDDTTTADTVYLGYAEIGTATSSASWKIKKIDTSSGAVVTWADGDNSYDNVWDNRASLSYS